MKKDAIIEAARKRLPEAIDADRNNRDDMLDDLKFISGKEQWPEKVRQEREEDGKPCLTINVLPQHVRQVTGDIRRLNPAINVLPANSEASEETAEIVEGLIRHIEYKSDASSVYEQTAESAAACSIGWFRVLNEWEDDDSFDQEIRIKRIRNPLSVYCDPSAEEPTRSDAQYIFITEQMSQEDFKDAYPEASTIDADADGITDGLERWQASGSVIVAEYYWREPVEKVIAKLVDGSVVENPGEEIPEEWIVQKRTVNTHKVYWAKVSGKDVLEGPVEQPCKTIPVIAVTGEEWHIGEEVHRTSVIRHAKEPQQLYNYHSSAEAEFVSLQPKAPYIGTLKQFEGLETFWNEANIKNRAFLPYNPDPKAPGAPQRATPPVSSQGISNAAIKAREDIKGTTGIYDAGLGARSNESSGVAIRQRQMESDVATSIYSDNMAKAIAQCGRIIIEMIPKIYDTNRMVRILGKDDQEKMVQINGVVTEAGQDRPVNDMTIGKYDVRVTVGPNYTTMRQETAEGMMNFIKAFPAAAQVTGDLIAKSQDWPDADKFAERLEKMLPPQVKDMENLSPEEQQQAMQAQQQAAMAQAMQQQAGQIEMQKSAAEAEEAVADAQKAKFEAQEQGLELAMKSGQLNAVIQNIVQEQVARALQSVFAQRGPF